MSFGAPSARMRGSISRRGIISSVARQLASDASAPAAMGDVTPPSPTAARRCGDSGGVVWRQHEERICADLAGNGDIAFVVTGDRRNANGISLQTGGSAGNGWTTYGGGRQAAGGQQRPGMWAGKAEVRRKAWRRKTRRWADGGQWSH